MWNKFMRYAHLHQINPNKYPSGRVPVEFSEFMADLKELMRGFFSDSDSIIGSMFIFFLDNPVLFFLISFGCAFGAFSLIRKALRVASLR